MRLCKDCKFYEQHFICGHPGAVDLVSGTTGKNAYVMRDNLLSCGPEGRWWEPAKDYAPKKE